MNRQTRQVLEVGAFFAVIVIILDLLLTIFPVLNWLGLGLAFAFAAIAIIGIVAQGIHRETRKRFSRQQKEDAFERLTNLVETGVYASDKNARRILWEHLKTLAIGIVAARTRLSRKEILDLLDNDPASLHNIVRDEELLKLLNGELHEENLTEKTLQGLLLKVGY